MLNELWLRVGFAQFKQSKGREDFRELSLGFECRSKFRRVEEKGNREDIFLKQVAAIRVDYFVN